LIFRVLGFLGSIGIFRVLFLSFSSQYSLSSSHSWTLEEPTLFTETVSNNNNNNNRSKEKKKKKSKNNNNNITSGTPTTNQTDKTTTCKSQPSTVRTSRTTPNQETNPNQAQYSKNNTKPKPRSTKPPPAIKKKKKKSSPRSESTTSSTALQNPTTYKS
jgi:outer membrane biosynthesis protein TonB